ncbi:MAG: WbqC family protein, partial [Saprospiraceae bacterium]|nr:WbqC family protein [Saprospiraceae bacterium]
MLLTELQILPPISTFTDGMRNGGLIIEAFENYQKKSLRNRFFLSSSNGRISISIPLQKGKSNQLKIKDVRVSYDENWIKNIHHTLTTVLGRSAFFEHYFDSVMGIFYSHIETLWDLNRALLQWAVEAGEISL